MKGRWVGGFCACVLAKTQKDRPIPEHTMPHMATMSVNDLKNNRKDFPHPKRKRKKKKNHTETSRRARDAVWPVPILLSTISNKLEWRD